MTTYVQRKFSGGMKRSAELSSDGLYRYVLVRRWGHEGGFATFVMLNPSTADATKDDPTILRCIAFAASWGFSALHVVNLYAFRSTDPKGLWTVPDPVGPDNNAHIIGHAAVAKTQGMPVIAAWGNNAKQDRVDAVLSMPAMDVLQCLGKTKSGAPKHPLARGHHRVPEDFVPVPYP